MTIWVLILLSLVGYSTAWAQTTGFTYQGNLRNGGTAANGSYDFELLLFDAAAGGTQIGTTLQRSEVSVVNGTFSLHLDFGGQFPGANRFLEIRVRQTGGGALTPLLPRQQINSSPYSIKSMSAETAVNAENAVTASNALQLGGVAANQYVLTADPRMSDARPPTAGSGNYIQNQNAGPQSSSNFNISGDGAIGGSLNVGSGISSFSESNIAVFGNSPFGTAGQFDGRLHVFRDGNATADLQNSQFRIIGKTNPARQFYFGYDTTANAAVIQAADTLVGRPMSLNPIGGFVGIGTVNPNSNIHLKANAPQGFAIQMENTSTAKRLYIGNYGTTGGGNHWSGQDSANTSFLYAENPLIFTTPGGIMFSGSTAAEHMRIGTNGNVGIGVGTTTPYKLQVLSQNPNAFAAHVNTEGLAAGTSYGLVVSAGTDAVDSALQIRDQAGNPLMRVRGNGYVGIGTTNALNRLHVSSSTSGEFSARIDNSASGSGSNGLLINAGDASSNWPLYVQDRTGGSFLFGVRGNGTIQIGGGAADLTGKLSVNGNAQVAGNLVVTGTLQVHTDGTTANAGSVCYGDANYLKRCTSSIRFKKNVHDFHQGLSIVNRLRPVTYDWKSNDRLDLGLIAEEVAIVNPLLATYDGTGQVEGVRYDLLGVVLINAVKEQQTQIEQQSLENADLKATVNRQQAEINSQRLEIDSLRQAVCEINSHASVCKRAGSK